MGTLICVLLLGIYCSSAALRIVFFSVMASCINSAPRYLVHIIGGRVGGGDKYRAETIRFGLNVVHKSRPYHLLMQEENGWDQPRILTRSENGEQTRNRFQRRTRICPPQWTDSWPLIILVEKLVTFFFYLKKSRWFMFHTYRPDFFDWSTTVRKKWWAESFQKNSNNSNTGAIFFFEK